MEDDCEKSAEKISAVPCEDTPVNENSNGLPPAPDEASLGVDESSNYVPNADFDESSQGFLAPSFGAGDNAVNFQENSINNEEESCDAAAIVSDGSRNGNDDSNPPCRASAVNTQQILNDIESSTMDEYVDETSEHLLNTDSNFVEHVNSREPAENSLEPVENPVEMVEDSVDLPENLVEPADDTQNISDEMLVEDVRELISAETKKEAQESEAITIIEKKVEMEPGREADTEVVSEDELPAVEKPRVQDAENVSDDELPGPRQAELPADTEQREAGREADTEVVSEDELPAVEKPRVQDAENVSDEELPGPRPADLPADTEVVSEDELPSSKKEREEEKGPRAAAVEGTEGAGSRKRKPENGERDSGSAGDDDNAPKKQAIVKNGESKPVAAEKRPSTEEKEKKKKALPELDKYWKVVNDDPSDFTGWTYLLQYVDQESDVEAAREAYDAFLSHYPYCYGYWRKYADYEKRKGSKKKCFEVLERGLKAIPLSVDLWIHFLNHIKTTKGEDLTYVRQQYDRAIEACGLEFRSDRLWESYIKWESEHGTPLNVTAIYDRLLATPTLSYTTHFDNFQEHIMSDGVASLVPREELVRIRAEVREGSVAPPAADLPPGEDEPEDHIATEEEGLAVKERVIALRRKVHKATGDQVAQRWTFEEGIKRPYFHVKPLERSQLKNWKAYLEWEKQHGTFKRALVLHERCLIACALYEEFWLRLVKFLEEASESDPSLVTLEREALERACTVHHLDKPALHLHWAYFEEAHGNVPRAADILERLEKACPNLLQVAYRRINLERRRGDLDKCVQLYESYIASAKSKPIGTALAIKYARFLQRVRSDAGGALRVLAEAATREPLAHRLYLQQLDIALHTPGTPYEQLSGYLEAYEKVEGAEVETSAAMAWRRLELAEELGTAAAARAAYNHQRTLARHLRKRARQVKREPSPPPDSSSQKKKDSSSSGGGVGGGSGGGGGGGGSAATASGAAAPPVGAGAYYPPSAPPPQPYDQQSYQQQYQPPWNHYQQHPPNPYHHNPWGQYPNYY